MDENLVDRVRRMQTESDNQYRGNVAEFERARSRPAFQMLSDSIQEFKDYIARDNYSDAMIRSVNGQDLITYPLFYPRSVDGDLYFSSDPVSLALDGYGNHSFLYETSRQGDTYHGYHGMRALSEPRHFHVANTLSEYQEHLAQRKGTAEYYDDTNLLKWSTEMHYYIQEKEHIKRTRSLQLGEVSHKFSIRQALIERYFPQGFDYGAHLRLLAQQALNS